MRISQAHKGRIVLKKAKNWWLMPPFLRAFLFCDKKNYKIISLVYRMIKNIFIQNVTFFVTIKNFVVSLQHDFEKNATI